MLILQSKFQIECDCVLIFLLMCINVIRNWYMLMEWWICKQQKFLVCRTQTWNWYIVTDTQEFDQNLQWLMLILLFWEGYWVYSVITTRFGRACLIPIICLSFYVEASKKHKLIFIQVNVPFLCTISTAENSSWITFAWYKIKVSLSPLLLFLTHKKVNDLLKD